MSICGEPAISLHSYTVSLVQWVNPLLPVMRDPGSIPRGVLMWNWDSPVSIVSLHWWPRHDWSLWPRLRGLHPEPSLGRRADNVIIPLDLTQLFCPGFTLAAAGPPSSFTTDIVGYWGGGPCGEPAISLHSNTVSLVQGVKPLLPVMRDPGSIPRGVLMWVRDSYVSVVSLHIGQNWL
jgi:hypothetical protein